MCNLSCSELFLETYVSFIAACFSASPPIPRKARRKLDLNEETDSAASDDANDNDLLPSIPEDPASDPVDNPLDRSLDGVTEDLPDEMVINEHSESCDSNNENFVSKGSQTEHEVSTDMLYAEINNLRKERDEALEKCEKLTVKLNKSNLSSSCTENDDAKCKMLTGLSWAVFLHVFSFLVPFVAHTRSTRSDSLPFREQFFLTLVKLRQNVPFEFLAEVKAIPKSTAVRYFLEMD